MMSTILIRTGLRPLSRDRRGVAAVEFSLIALFLITLMLAAYDFGNAEQEHVQLQQAVRAGGAYAAAYPTDPTGIATAVTSALPTGWSLTAPPSIVCKCLDSSTGATTTTVCTTPNCATDAKIISISATLPTASISGLFNGFIPATTANYVVRYQ
jgi:Flp pilus assembly protein TadG